MIFPSIVFWWLERRWQSHAQTQTCKQKPSSTYPIPQWACLYTSQFPQPIQPAMIHYVTWPENVFEDNHNQYKLMVQLNMDSYKQVIFKRA